MSEKTQKNTQWARYSHPRIAEVEQITFRKEIKI